MGRDIFSDSYDQQLSDLNFKALRVYFCMRRGLQVNLNWVISWRCSQFNQKTNNQSQTLLAPRQREHYWGHLSSRSNAWVHCQCSEGGMSFGAKYQICAEKCHNNALDASGISESLEKLLVFKFAIFWKGGRKVAVCEVSVKNYDIFFSGQEIWFCLNRKKIGNHLRVNLKCCKLLQSSSCFHNW